MSSIVLFPELKYHIRELRSDFAEMNVRTSIRFNKLIEEMRL